MTVAAAAGAATTAAPTDATPKTNGTAASAATARGTNFDGMVPLLRANAFF
jgi:hypothetical protein